MSAVRLWADDLTGACEVADFVRARRGAAAVHLGAPEPPRAGPVVVDVDLRHADDDAATARLAALLAEVPATERVAFKIDSQLHGPVSAYLAAFVARRRRVFFCPANLDAERFVVDGAHRVPSPAGSASTDLGGLVPHRGGHLVTTAWNVVDSASLHRFAAAAHDYDVIGSAAFVDAWLAGFPAWRVDSEPDRSAEARGLMMIVGSTEPIIDEQLADLRIGHAVEEYDARHARPIDAAQTLRRGGVALLRVPPGGLAAASEFTLAALSEPEGADAALMLTGGHTARGVLAALGTVSLASCPSPIAGVASLRDAGGRSIFTKPGSYGRGSTLRDVADVVLAPSPEEYP